MKQIRAQDARSWYDRLNAVLTGHGLDSISMPEISGTARAAQVTPLADKLEGMKEDPYYKFASYGDWGAVVKGAVMRELTPSGIEATLNSVEVSIVCRNTAQNSYGTCSNGSNSDGANSNGTKSNGIRTNGWKTNAIYGHTSCSETACSHNQKSNGSYSAGSNSDGNKSNGSKSYGTNDNGSEIDTGNSNGSHTN